jgi:chromosome segregation ATPase
MPETKPQDLERDITNLQKELVKHDEQIRELQAKINHLVFAPDLRAKNLQDLENQLSKARINNEIAQEQQKMYKGTDLEQVTVDDAIQSSGRVRQLEKQIDEQRRHNAEQDALDTAKRADLEAQMQKLIRFRTNIQNIISRLQNERDELHNDAGKKIYQECMAAYQQEKQKIAEQERQTEQMYQDIESLQFDILKKLDEYPELQRLFMQEHNVTPSDGPTRVCLAAICYLESLIADHLELENCYLSDGRHVTELMALTDQEILANTYQGGLYNLQDKRSELLDFVEQRKAMQKR